MLFIIFIIHSQETQNPAEAEINFFFANSSELPDPGEQQQSSEKAELLFDVAGAGAQTCSLKATPWLTASWLTLASGSLSFENK